MTKIFSETLERARAQAAREPTIVKDLWRILHLPETARKSKNQVKLSEYFF